MNQDKIKALAMELYKNEEVAIELANIIFGIRDGDYEPEKFEFKFEVGSTYIVNMESFTGRAMVDSLTAHKYGRYRKTQQGAELSLKRNQRANRLEMLVEYLGGLKEFVKGEENCYIRQYKGDYSVSSDFDIFHPERVYITKDGAYKVCELLKSGAYSLEG
jgi:hypothetical protein